MPRYSQPIDRPGLALDAPVAASGRPGGADVHELLDELSHVDPDREPLRYGFLWARVWARDLVAVL